MFLRKGAFFKFQVLLCTVLSITLLYHIFKASAFPQVAAFDEQLQGTGVILFSRLHTCETLISQTPVYPLIYGSCSIIKHQHYVCTSYSVIIDPLINCLQDIIMHIRCEMQSTYARSVLMGTTKLVGGERGKGEELCKLIAFLPRLIFISLLLKLMLPARISSQESPHQWGVL